MNKYVDASERGTGIISRIHILSRRTRMLLRIPTAAGVVVETIRIVTRVQPLIALDIVARGISVFGGLMDRQWLQLGFAAAGRAMV